jgi:hypothetical protein
VRRDRLAPVRSQLTRQRAMGVRNNAMTGTAQPSKLSQHLREALSKDPRVNKRDACAVANRVTPTPRFRALLLQLDVEPDLEIGYRPFHFLVPMRRPGRNENHIPFCDSPALATFDRDAARSLG